MGFADRLQHAWNAFKDPYNDPLKTNIYQEQVGGGVAYYVRPDRPTLRYGNEQSIVNAIYTRIAIDVAQTKIEHVRVDENGRYKATIESGLNRCLTTEANVDQTGRSLIQDAVLRLCDTGVIAIVPIAVKDTPMYTVDYVRAPATTIVSLRVGTIVQWKPRSVQVRLYNDMDGTKQDVWFPKSFVAVIENPFYTIMNEVNSTLRRLVTTLNRIDQVDDNAASGKLDVIIQLPYSTRSPKLQEQAETRRKQIEVQLSSSKYGIAYTGATEHITQLNRPVDNNLQTRFEYLTRMLYSQLGITENILNGTANEQEMINYTNRTIEPFLAAITSELDRKFITQTARSQGQTIAFFRDPFRLVPASQVAELSDKLTRNEILSSNEVRAIIGYKPVDDPRADELRNANLNQKEDEQAPQTTAGNDAQEETPKETERSNTNG